MPQPSDTTPVPPRRGRPGNDRRDVIAAAVALFNEHGYEATTIGMIADQLGVSKSAIYHHVRSKEDLLEAATDHAMSALERILDAPEANHGPAMNRLEYVIRGTIATLTTDLAEVTLLLRLRGNTDMERLVLQRRRAFDRRVTALVAEVSARQPEPPLAHPRVVTRLLFGMINSIAEWYRPAGSLSADQLGDLVVTLVTDGLRPRRAPDPHASPRA